MQRHPLIGQEYSVEDIDGIDAESIVPVDHDDTGNLVCHHYYDDNTMGTQPWSEDGFREYVNEGSLTTA